MFLWLLYGIPVWQYTTLFSLLSRIEDRKITHKDLLEAADEETGKSTTRMGFRRQDSDAARMYN